MMIRTLMTACIFLGSATAVMAHESPIHEHTQLVPIPAYTQPYGEASAKASLSAAEKFLASFDEAAKEGLVV